MMQYTDKEKELMKIDEDYREPRQRIVCADGFTMSVQANLYTHCMPRDNDCRWYAAVEVGFPSEREELLMPWMDMMSMQGPTTSIYPFTPAKVVMDVIVKHGGMVHGELPPLAMAQDEEE